IPGGRIETGVRAAADRQLAPAAVGIDPHRWERALQPRQLERQVANEAEADHRYDLAQFDVGFPNALKGNCRQAEVGRLLRRQPIRYAVAVRRAHYGMTGVVASRSDAIARREILHLFPQRSDTADVAVPGIVGKPAARVGKAEEEGPLRP